MKIHHNTVKRAARAGIQLVVTDDMVEAVHAERGVLARCADPKDALDLALRELNGGSAPKRTRKAKSPKKVREDSDDGDDGEGDEGEDELSDEELGLDGEEGEDEKETASVVKPKYRQKYRPHKHTCGDSLTQQIRREFMTKIDPDS